MYSRLRTLNTVPLASKLNKIEIKEFINELHDFN